jgi:Na+/melibiose symporter-like transporter
MAEKLEKSILYTYGIADLFFIMLVNMEMFYFTAFLTEYVQFSMSTALFTDTVTYGEWKTGKSIRAFTMALANFPIKIGILIRSAAITLGLAAIGFVSNTVPSPDVINGITSIMTLAPAAACILAAAVFYFGYKIEDKHVQQMQEEIAARAENFAHD